MSGVGRGRGYTGRHHHRPGDDDRPPHENSPRAVVPPPTETREKRDSQTESEKDREENRREKREEDFIRENLESISAEDDAALKELLQVDEQYQPLLVLLDQFSPSEDGIQFNRKLRHFESTITSMCPDESRLQQAFASFRAASLLNPVTARKLAAVGASFTRQQRQHLLRTTLLNVIMQGTYSKLDILERANPLFLINAANLMGDYFAEARLCNGNKVHLLAAPLLHYMRALLAQDDNRAHRSLATQLMQNGRELLSVLSQDLDELSIAVRLRILTPPPCGIIWLLLSSDMCLNKFLPLPNSLQQFYAAHLNLTPDESYSEVTYGSWKKTDNDEEKISHNVSNVSLSEDDAKPKLRPILGAGAGLLRQEQSVSVSQDTFETWNSQKTSLSKRYDLNSWRQEEEKEPLYDPTVLPPNYTEYPPPRYNQNYQENYNNYLQQGDGTYIQNQFYNQEPREFFQETKSTEKESQNAQTVVPESSNKSERVNSEVQKASSRKPVENWRKEKGEFENWTRQQSRDNLSSEEDNKRSLSRNSRPVNRMSRRNSGDSEIKTPQRHVSDVPRNHKYWDHDDRCDKDYNS